MASEKQRNLRLTEEEDAMFVEAAERAGIPVSEWLRQAGLAAAGKCPLCGAKRKPKGKR